MRVNHNALLGEYHYHGNHHRGMRNVALRSMDVPFVTEICHSLPTIACRALGLERGVAPCSTITSEESKEHEGCHQVVFSTYLGTKEVAFWFVNSEADISVDLSDGVQEIPPQKTFPPNWWQRLSIGA
jgi:hypothetical protein